MNSIEKRDIWEIGGLDSPRICGYQYYLKNRAEGEYKTWHSNGEIHEQKTYRNGELEGIKTVWYPNGRINYLSLYRFGNLEGMCIDFFANGFPYSQTFWKNGKLEGEYKKWFEHGGLAEHGKYYSQQMINAYFQDYSYVMNGSVIDCQFTLRKKHSFLKIKSKYFRSPIPILDIYTISDLAKMIYELSS